MTTTADDYVNKVMQNMPRAMPLRSQIALELRSHIAERVSGGASIEDVIRQLGDPAALANSYLAAETLLSAPFGRRAAAKIIDALLLIAVAAPLLVIWSRILSSELFPIAILAMVFATTAMFGLYAVISESVYGQTFGKRAMEIRVVTEAGGRISIGQAVVRQLPVFLQVFWIDVMFALFTEKSQRAFELLSKTRVVRAEPVS
jgi:uncharacterized RDD family membrane protein YckC